MTARLEAALKRLNDEQIERVTTLAESLADPLTNPKPNARMKFDWVGGLKNEPEKSGVEAQQTAMREWTEMIERNLGR